MKNFILIEPTVDIRIRIRGCQNSHIRIRIRGCGKSDIRPITTQESQVPPLISNENFV